MRAICLGLIFLFLPIATGSAFAQVPAGKPSYSGATVEILGPPSKEGVLRVRVVDFGKRTDTQSDSNPPPQILACVLAGPLTVACGASLAAAYFVRPKIKEGVEWLREAKNPNCVATCNALHPPGQSVPGVAEECAEDCGPSSIF